MNFDLFAARSTGEDRMRFDVRQLANDSRAILRRFEPIALAAALLATLLFAFVLGLPPIVALLLGAALYPGVALLMSRSLLVAEVVEPLTPEEEAFLRMRASTDHVLALAGDVEKPEIRERVVHIGETFQTMLGVMEKDRSKTRFASAPEYEVDVVEPFEKKLEYYVFLSERGVELAAPQIAQFEDDELRQYEKLTKLFYQHYHDWAVMDFAALLEIFRDVEKDDESDFEESFDHDDDIDRERTP